MKILGQKNLGMNSTSGQNMVFQIIGFQVDGLNETIIIQWRVCDVSQNGLTFYPFKYGSYMRSNLSGNEKFNDIFNSETGQEVLSMFSPDLGSVSNVNTIDSDLIQKGGLFNN